MALPRPDLKGKGLSLTITALNDSGYGVGQKAGQTILVSRTVPGDQVITGPPWGPGRWTSAALVKVTKAGPDRVQSPCQFFDQGCAGCQWLHLSYQAQLASKEKTLSSILRTKAGFKGPIHPIISMERPYGFRNKLSLKNIGGRLHLVPETDGEPMAPETCVVQTPALQRAWVALRSLRVPAAIEQVHLRSNSQGQVGIHVFIKEGSPGGDQALKALGEACPGSVGLGATGRQGGYRPVLGDPVLAQTIGTTTWLIPHNGFFQTNEVQAAALLDLVRREAKVKSTDRVLDLYCGAGFFGLALARGAKEILGIEENPQSVQAAGASALRSGITNARFLAGDMGTVLASLEDFPGETAVVDPPREGLLPRALEAIASRKPRRIVYISCYAPSMVRDYKFLASAGWRGISCTPVDMFPHTSHLETVVTLDR